MRKFVIITSLLFLVFFDMGSKILVEDYLFGSSKKICDFPQVNSAATPEYCQENTIRLSDFLSIKLAYNEGIAFSLPLEGLPLQIITVMILLGLAYFYIRDEYPKNSRLLDAAYVFIFAGALSHAYERIFIGHVVDFISIKYFAILNFADIFISVGAFFILLYYAISHRRHR